MVLWSTVRLRVLITALFLTWILWMLPIPWITADSEIYMRMVAGEAVEAPFSFRILIPLLVSVLGGTWDTFVGLNFVFFFLTLLLFGDFLGGITGQLIFFAGSFPVLTVVIPTPMIDAAILFLTVLSMWLVDRRHFEVSPHIVAIAIATHPIAFVLVSIVFLTDKRVSAKQPIVVFMVALGVMILILQFISGYGASAFLFLRYPGNQVIAAMLPFLGGYLCLRREPLAYAAILAFIACIGFSMIGSYTEKMVYFIGLFSVPYIILALDDLRDILHTRRDQTEISTSVG